MALMAILIPPEVSVLGNGGSAVPIYNNVFIWTIILYYVTGEKFS